jgi:hypothetical protein
MRLSCHCVLQISMLIGTEVFVEGERVGCGCCTPATSTLLTARRDNTRLSSASSPSPDLSASTLPASAQSVHCTNVPLHHLWTWLQTRPRAPFVPLSDAGEGALSLPGAVK